MHKMRNPSGAGMIASALFAAFFIILPLGILGFEYMRFSIAQLQLRSICDASALSGACGVASAQATDITTAHETAMRYAFQTFRQNILMGSNLADPNVCSDTDCHMNDGFRPTTAPPGKCIVAYTLLDQNFTPVQTSDSRAKLIRCEAVYGYVPPIGGALGFTNCPLIAYSEGGLPSLDIVMCFDVSGSMDDQTSVSFVKRYFSGAYTHYQVVSRNRSLGGNGLPWSSINNILEPAPTTGNGTRVNATAPQNLHYTMFSNAAYTSGNKHTYTFLPNLRCAPTISNEVGAPPGNVTDSSISTGGSTDYTDMVVNLDYNTTNYKFKAITDPVTNLSFPNIGTVVEAARGNLDLTAAQFDTACPGHNNPASDSLGPSVTPDSSGRYYSTYQTLANDRVQPMKDARDAAGGFFTTMNISANCHFGFVAFADDIGTDENTTITVDPVDDTPYGKAQGTPFQAPLPLVKLADVGAAPLDTKFTECSAAVTRLRATNGTNIAASLNEAIAELTTTATPLRTRPKARRCIVLFTDGIPTLPGGSQGGSNSPAAQACYTAANSCVGKIKIYAIGLSQNSTVRPTMQRVLDGITRPTGGQYFLVDDPSQLNKAFQDIAKALIVLR